MFAREGYFPPVGLFSMNHIVSMVICLFAIGVAIVLSKNMNKQKFLSLLKKFTIILTCIEVFKILWSFANGLTAVNNWVPLFFCSIFIYSLWFTWSKNEKIRNLGLSFIAYAGFIAGMVFLVCPSSSFTRYPIFHFQCMYSMLYHSIMVYCGIAVFITRSVELNAKSIFNYFEYCAIFMLLALYVNVNFGGNLMFMMHPKGIPLAFLNDIYMLCNGLYSVLLLGAHLLMGPVVYGFVRLCEKVFKFNYNEQTEECDVELDIEDDELEHKHS